jgi:hypothetical protein
MTVSLEEHIHIGGKNKCRKKMKKKDRNICSGYIVRI